MTLWLAKILFGIVVPLWGVWDLYNYAKAKKYWIPTTGVVVGRKRSGRNTYPIVKFETEDGKEIEFEGFVMLPAFIYKDGKQVDVLYSKDTPDKAIMATLFNPLFDLFVIATGLYLGYLLFFLKR